MSGKKCWICLLDEQESDMKWVSPCKCRKSLRYVHEDCLLHWLDEREATGLSLKCSICQYEYQVAQESGSLALSFVDFMHGLIDFSAPIISISMISSSILFLATAYGGYVVISICGPQMAETILTDAPWNARTWAGLASIPFCLILSTMRYSDPLLLIWPLSLLARDLGPLTFPPSPALTICTLPFVRFIYNTVWGWIFKARPRLTEAEHRKSVQKKLIAVFMLPGLSAVMGSLLSFIPFIRRIFPLEFHRNILGGCALVTAVDLISYFSNRLKQEKKKRRHVRDYRGSMDSFQRTDVY